MWPLPSPAVSNTIRGEGTRWTKTLAAELGPRGITVNRGLPGATLTQRHISLVKQKTVETNMPADEVEAAILKLISANQFG